MKTLIQIQILAARNCAGCLFGAILLAGLLSVPAALTPAPPGRAQQLDTRDAVPNGLSAPEWSSIRQQYEQHRHAAVPVDGGHQARNPGQQWLTRFDGRGFITQPNAGGWQWGLELKSYGMAGQLRAASGWPSVRSKGQRVTYDWDDNLQEWFVNDARGLEHGFTLKHRPTDGPSFNFQPSTLNLLLAVRGGLRPEVQADGRSVRFVDERGVAALTYAGLTVFDADGQKLPAHFEPVEGSRRSNEAGFVADCDAQEIESFHIATSAAMEGLRLVIDERGARYPLTIDPIAQQAYLKASNTAVSVYDNFGYAVAVAGDTLVVGAPRESSNATGVNGNQSDNSASASGAAYVFVRSGGVWTQQAYLKASNTEDGDSFGWSVAVAGDTVVVGAYVEDSNAVGVNGVQSNNLAFDSGAAYVFVRDGTNWTQQAYLKASNTGAGDAFGSSVAVTGDTVVIGAAYEDSNAVGVNGDQSNNTAENSGAAYVFVRSGTTWTQQAYLKASNTEGALPGDYYGDFFGWSVAVSGDTVVVGGIGEDSNATGINGNQTNNSAGGSGAAYVFVRSGTTWSQQAYLKASNTGGGGVADGDTFGLSVALAGDTVVIGAAYEDSNATGVNANQSDNSASQAGAAYVFVRNGTTWLQQAYLKASNTGADDLFGVSVAVSGDTVVVGAFAEASNATGVNGDESNDSKFGSGAAYVFMRNGTNWSQVAYLKASNTDAGDVFGGSVAVSGGFVVVGAYDEDSNATGVNGGPCDNGAGGSGAAYVFDLNSTIILAPEIAVEQPLGNALSAGTAVVQFASGRPGTTSQRTFTIRNIGNADLTGLAITVSGPNATQFTVTTNPVVTLSGPCGTSTFTVNFAPGPAGTNTAVLHLANNDPDESPFDITLTGTALTPLQVAQQAYAKASNTGAGDNFGTSVAISGDTMVVGSPYEDSNATGVNGIQTNNSAGDSGAAYVFVRDGTNWTQQAYLKASNTGIGDDRFGYKVAISGDTIVIAAIGEDSNATGVNGNQTNNLADSSGAAYVFVRSGTNWTQQAYLKASNTGVTDFFGAAVAVAGDTVVVGADREASNATGVNGNQTNNLAFDSGAAYVFVRDGTNWTQQAYLKASNTGSSDQFGWSVAVEGDTVVIGAKAEDSNATGVNGNQAPNTAGDSGAAYVFVRSGTNWSQQAYLKASNTGPGDQFGWSVAVAGDTVVVGADLESSNATGVNGNQTNNSALHSGAAYVFVRNETNWTQQAYLKASNTGLPIDDEFGWSVAVSGDMVLIGALGEDSNAKGVNGDQNNNGGTDSGAAYVFMRSGTNWSQQAYLKASNPGGNDYFGGSVSMSGETVVIGALYEASDAKGVNGNQTNNNTGGAGAAYVFTGIGLRHPLYFAPDGSGGYWIRFDGVPTFPYRLERASSVTGPWDSIATNTAPASGFVEFHDTNPPPDAAFYRTVTP